MSSSNALTSSSSLPGTEVDAGRQADLLIEKLGGRQHRGTEEAELALLKLGESGTQAHEKAASSGNDEVQAG